MVSLEKLSVSLTKHGAYKIAMLLEKYDTETVLSKTRSDVDGIDIDRAQAAKHLSADSTGTLPVFWKSVKVGGPTAIFHLVMLAIIFSHHGLIKAFRMGGGLNSQGVISVDMLPGRKAFSNIKNNVIELGFCTSANSQKFTYDFSSMFNSGIPVDLVIELLKAKLKEALWDGVPDFESVCIEAGVHEVLAIDASVFRTWISGAAVTVISSSSGDSNDVLPDVVDHNQEAEQAFEFASGHKRRKEGEVPRTVGRGAPVVRLIHNELQSKMYSHLVQLHGPENVGTEIRSGSGKDRIDLARKVDGGYVLYEIKTSRSLKKAIREALSQILEYAHWNNNQTAVELVIVSRARPTKSATSYLKKLRTIYNLPIYHETVNADTGELTDRI